MSYLERIDKNIDPDLARSWLALAWEEMGKDFDEIGI